MCILCTINSNKSFTLILLYAIFSTLTGAYTCHLSSHAFKDSKLELFRPVARKGDLLGSDEPSPKNHQPIKNKYKGVYSLI
jgi:hypothetical protein